MTKNKKYIQANLAQIEYLISRSLNDPFSLLSLKNLKEDFQRQLNEENDKIIEKLTSYLSDIIEDSQELLTEKRYKYGDHPKFEKEFLDWDKKILEITEFLKQKD